MLGGWFEKNIMYIVFFHLCGYEVDLLYLVVMLMVGFFNGIKTFLVDR
jgi:hypothetical protein